VHPITTAKETPDKFKHGKGEKSQFWMELAYALSILEDDFKSIDKDGSGKHPTQHLGPIP